MKPAQKPDDILWARILDEFLQEEYDPEHTGMGAPVRSRTLDQPHGSIVWECLIGATNRQR